jgi:uncharacterized membrane protein YgdD (TMEM256/DUF423 family)
MRKNTILALVGILGALAVGLGAFGAHALKELLAQNGYTEVFRTANQYHFYHTFALALIALLPQPEKYKWATYSFIVGIVLFSGSLYLLSITKISILGAITPFGGVFFIAGWLILCLNTLLKPLSNINAR